MSERLDFVRACVDRTEHIVRICDRFGISEKTGQKWLKRFKEGGLDALEDRSHAPLTHKGRITSEVSSRILALKKKYPLYGPEKIHDWLEVHEPRGAGLHWPAVSSIGELLKRSGLVRKKRRRHPLLERADLDSVRTRSSEPNMVWTADFKGEFKLNSGLGSYCYPLTVLDLNTHYLLDCRALDTTAVLPTQQAFERLFIDYGLPRVMRTDNGVPFAQPNAVGRIGKLAFWWVRLGIRPEYITPGRPSENGAHERFHRTLKAATTKPSSKSFRTQQKRFDEFRNEYNSERPHSGLPEHRPPAQFYQQSPRPFPRKLPVVIYPDGSVVRLVDRSGNIKWQNQAYFLSTNLKSQYVALAEGPEDLIYISYGPLELGAIDPHNNRFVPRLKWHG
jgi:transposase InsO family protein